LRANISFSRGEEFAGKSASEMFHMLLALIPSGSTSIAFAMCENAGKSPSAGRNSCSDLNSLRRS
jgi:hypothetical protein